MMMLNLCLRIKNTRKSLSKTLIIELTTLSKLLTSVSSKWGENKPNPFLKQLKSVHCYRCRTGMQFLNTGPQHQNPQIFIRRTGIPNPGTGPQFQNFPNFKRRTGMQFLNTGPQFNFCFWLVFLFLA